MADHASQLGQQLPHGVLECLCSAVAPRQRAALSAVCREWRDAVLHSTTTLAVNLRSDNGAASISGWLEHHAVQLTELELSTVGLYGRHIHHPTRLALFQALHAAAGSTAAQPEAVAAGHDSSSDGEEEHHSGSKRAQKLEQHGQHDPAVSPSEGAAAAAAEGVPTSAAAPGALPAAGAIPPQQPQLHNAAAAAVPAAAAAAAAGAIKPLRLTHLAANMRLAPADCAAIASLPAPQLASLALLGSRTRRLGFDGVGSLVRLQQLTCLKVERLGIGDDATVLLARHLTGLLQLSLSGNNIGPAGAAGIAQHLTGLEALDLSVNRIKDAGLSSLCSTLHRLQSLSLSGNIKFTAATLQQLHPLQRLSQLLTSSNTLGNQGLAALAAALPSTLQVLDVANNKISKLDPVPALVGLTSLHIGRNPLQQSSTKVLAAAGLSKLQELVLFDAASAKTVAALAGLAASLTSLTLGCDPGTTSDDATNLPLSKTRTCSALFTALAEAGKLQAFAAPCTGLGDAQAKLLARFKGRALVSLNLSYNYLSPEGLSFLKDLPQLRRLEVRAMRPELSDAAARVLAKCSRLELLDVADNDLSSEGVRQLGAGQLQRLEHLNLRNNVQVEKYAVMAAAPGLSALTYLNLLELSDVAARPGVRPAGGTAAAAAAAAAAGGPAAAAAAAPAHADIWAALPNLQELVVGAYNQAGGAYRSGRVMISCGG